MRDVMVVYCLCADWCGVCRTLKPALGELQLPGIELQWIDIEEEPEWVDAEDITSFPTLVIKAGGRTVFTGAVEPNLPQIRRLLLSLHDAFIQR